MKRFFSFFLILCISMSTMASSTSRLEKAMDEYQYSLSVDWDQKDQAVYQAMTDAFLAEMDKIITSEGLSKEQILAVAEKRMNNKNQFEALKLKLALASKIKSVQELGTIVQESVNDMYSRGASWNGDVITPIAIGLVLASAAGYSIWFSANHECVSSSESYECWSFCDALGVCKEKCGIQHTCTEYVKI